MIENLLQLKTSEYWLSEFKKSLEDVKSERNIDPILKDAIIGGHQSIIDELTINIEVFNKNLPKSNPDPLY